MQTIVVSDLKKTFQVNEKGQGLRSTFASLISPKKRIVTALEKVNFNISKGEFVGFIGPNGAGKTTTLKILSGILHPTSGIANVAGFTPWNRKKDFLKSITLIMGQKNQLWWDLPAIETFELHRAIYEIPPKVYKKNLDELVSLLSVEDLLTTQVRKLSLGQRMRMELIAALLHKPEVVFLDEPTIGLDVVAQEKVRDFLFSYNKRTKATIILTSHNMDDLVNLTKRVIVINQGLIVFDGALSDLTQKVAKTKTIKISLSDGANYKILENIGKIKLIDLPQVTISVPRANVASAASEILKHLPVEDLTIEEESIDDIIRRFFKSSHK